MIIYLSDHFEAVCFLYSGGKFVHQLCAMVNAMKKQVDVELLLQPQCSDDDVSEATAWVLRALVAEDDWYWRRMPSNQLLQVPPTLQHVVHSVSRCDMQENLCGVLACQASHSRCASSDIRLHHPPLPLSQLLLLLCHVCESAQR